MPSKRTTGASIYVRYAGMRHGSPEVMARVAQANWPIWRAMSRDCPGGSLHNN
jgi:hypothetical protein